MSFSTVEGGGDARLLPSYMKPAAPAPPDRTYNPTLGPDNVPITNSTPTTTPVSPFSGGAAVSTPSSGAPGSAPTNVGTWGAAAPFPTPQGPTVDVQSLLQKALANMGFSNIDTSLQKAREQLITRFGDANLANLAGFGIDPQAGAFAQQNYISGNADLAKLDKSRDLAKKAVINRLASHGILFSGDLGHGLSQAESQYGNQRYDLTQNYLQQLQSLLDNSLQQKQSLRSNVVNALLSAYGNQVKNPDELIGLYGG